VLGSSGRDPASIATSEVVPASGGFRSLRINFWRLLCPIPVPIHFNIPVVNLFRRFPRRMSFQLQSVRSLYLRPKKNRRRRVLRHLKLPQTIFNLRSLPFASR